MVHFKGSPADLRHFEEISELYHNTLHGAQSQINDTKLSVYGHVTSFDPVKHAVKVKIPQGRTVEDDDYETDWIQLQTFAVGNRSGFQWAPEGAGDDEDKPGEQVEVKVFQRDTGVQICAGLTYSDLMKPPGSGEDDGEQYAEDDKGGWEEDPRGRNKLEGGELVYRHPKGSFVKFYKDGNFQAFVAKDSHCYIEGDVNVVVRKGDANVTLEKGNANVDLQEGNADVWIEKGNARLDVDEGDLDIKVALGNTTIETTMGDTVIQSEAGNIMATTEAGDVALQTTAGSCYIEAGTDIELVAEGVINLIAPIVNAGNPALTKRLLNELAMLIYNGHAHPVPGGMSGPPDVQMEVGLATTVEFEAS